MIRTWLIGVTAVALVVAVADSLSPDGAARKIGKLTGGLLMMVAILNPLVKIDSSVLAAAQTDFRLETGAYSSELEIENQRLIKSIIEEQVGAYIQDKAAETGIACTAKVACVEDEDGNLYPESVVVYGEMNQGQMKLLSRTIEEDLAILPQNQQFEREMENDG